MHSGLLAARLVAGADVAVVAQGPGNLGTGTRWGFSGVSAGEAVNAAGVLRGRPVAALRVSAADARERHRGVSHHSLTALGRVALVPADVVVPLLPGPVRRAACQAAGCARWRAGTGWSRWPLDGLRRGAGRLTGPAVDDGPRPATTTRRPSSRRPPPGVTPRRLVPS